MASTAILQIKMVAALLESIDQDDKGDAEQAIRMIRSLLASDEKAGPAKS